MQEPGRFAGKTAAPPDTPLVFAARIKGAFRLGAVDACARRHGIVPGMALADVRARFADLIVADMDADADHHWLQRLARRCIDWSPLVTVAPPDGITLDSAGVEHLFGGEAGLAAQVEDAMTALGMNLRLAFAATAEAAQALARHARLPVGDEQQAIRALPVAALGLDADATLALRRAGLKTVGAVAQRPAASLAARFGTAAVTALHRLTGAQQAPLDPLPQITPLRFERRFPDPVGHQATIARHVLGLLREGTRTLEARALGGRHFRLTLLRSDGAQHRLDIETGLPTRDPAQVLRLFDERIATLADPLDPGFGYDSIALFIARTEPLAPGQPTLDGSAREDAALADLIDRLSTRLGAQSLHRLVPQDTHVPEQAQRAQPAICDPAPVCWPSPPGGEPPLRPLFLFDPPQPITAIAEVPDGPPCRFRWRQTLHEVQLSEGPERIAAPWWQHGAGDIPDATGLTRDYYRIEDRQGRRYWIFRHGLYEERSDPRWYLHGLFA